MSKGRPVGDAPLFGHARVQRRKAARGRSRTARSGWMDCGLMPAAAGAAYRPGRRSCRDSRDTLFMIDFRKA